MSEEYLLRELTTQGFLPAHGFPSTIVAFNNLTIADEIRRKERSLESRIDNSYQRRELPSRDIVTGIREYAPGSDIVINGLVYRSEGITLNWHIPAAAEQAREIQSFRFAWRCRRCGANGTSMTLQGALICSECGVSVLEGDREEYLDPAGFSVDFYKEPTNDLTWQSYIPFERPWISAPGNWQKLGEREIGRFKVSAEGKVYHHSGGFNGTGYAICLACGRASAMTADKKMPAEFSPRIGHNRLRSKKADRVCDAQSWSIKDCIMLGHETLTDIAEIQLKNMDGFWLSDANTALTISAGLRNALADILGIQISELGNDIREANAPDGTICQSIFIYDRNAAGYSTTLERHLPKALELAAQRMNCIKGCDTSCPSCLMDYEQRFRASRLDRHSGQRFLTDKWLEQVVKPQD
jgi:hypothetical protein